MQNSIEKLLRYIDEAEIAQFFAEIDRLGISDPEINGLRKKFIANKTDENFAEQLKVYVKKVLPSHEEIPEDKWLSEYVPLFRKYVLPRTELLETLHKKLQEDSRKPFLVKGLGGFGKTVLAKLYVEKYHTEYEKIIWLEFSESLEQSLLALYPRLFGKIDENGSVEKRAEMIIGRLAAMPNNQRKLLVLNNLDQTVDLKKLGRLCFPNPWRILLVGRASQHETIPMMPMPELDLGEAMLLFSQHIDASDSIDLEILIPLLADLHFHPQLIELVAKQIAAYPNLKLENMATLLRSGGLLKPSEQREVRVEKDDIVAEKTIRQVMETLFDPQKLDMEEQIVLGQMASLPAISLSPEILQDTIGKTPFSWKTLWQRWFSKNPTVRYERFYQILNALAEKGWVKKEKRHYQLHPLIHALLLEQMQAFIRLRAKTYIGFNRNLADYYWQNLQAINYLDCLKHTWRLCERYYGQNHVTSYEVIFVLINQLINFGLVSQAEGYLKDLALETMPESAQAEYHFLYGSLKLTQNAKDQSLLEHYEKALSLFEKQGNKKRIGSTFHNMALFYEENGKPKEAIAYYEKSIKIKDRKEKHGLAQTYANLGKLYVDTRQYAEADQALQKALEWAIRAGDLTLAHVYHKFAYLEYSMQDYEVAMAYIEQSLDIYEKVYADIPFQPDFVDAKETKVAILRAKGKKRKK